MLKTFNEPPQPRLSRTGPAVLALGFRPFFILASVGSILLVALWILFWTGTTGGQHYYGTVGWHGHEMLFGYVPAVIAGFLLTAVRNWTGVNTPTGPPLGAVALLWLLGRLLPLIPGTPPTLTAAVDLAFLPLVAMMIRPALWQGKQRVNRIFVPILLLMAAANLLVHLDALGLAPTGPLGRDTMMHLIAFLLVIIGGRVIPFFSKAVLPGYEPRSIPFVEYAGIIMLGAVMIAEIVEPPAWVAAVPAALFSMSQLIRVLLWHDRRVWSTPILWVLYAGFLWLSIGYAMYGLAAIGLVPVNAAKHALTVGAIGTVTLGMMARISLGHTGFPIQPRRVIEISFIVLNLAAAARVFGVVAMPEKYLFWIHLSGGLWILCFAVFAFVYVPILVRPRADGRPG